MDAITITQPRLTLNTAAIENGQRYACAARHERMVHRNLITTVAVQCRQIERLLAALEVYGNPANFTLDGGVYIFDGPGKHPSDTAIEAINAYRIKP